MFAMKVVNVETMGGSLRELKQELDIQSQLDHPNIAKVFESYIDEENGEMAIIMEMCTGGSLVQRVCESDHGFDERAAATLVEKILSATIYCHHHGVVHRDIKLDNFIYENESSESELKLIDFGFACEIQSGGEEAMWDRLGSPSYMAPELYDEGTIYDSSVDMWAIGVVAYMLLSGKRPFHHADPRVKADQIRNDPLRFSERQWEHVSDDAKDFCLQLMQKRPRDRLSATAARDHRWIQHTSSVHAIADASHGRFQRRFQSVSVIQSLNAFTEADDLKKLALEVIAFSTPPSKLKELREMFVKIDVDDSGTLSLDEFKAAMALHPDVPQDRVEQIFNTMDHEGSGEVDYSMFLSAMLGRRRSLVSNTNSIMAAFTTLDTDGDGYITQADLASTLGAQHVAADGALADMLSVECGIADAQGRVTYQAFKKMMLRGIRNSVVGEAGSIPNVGFLEGGSFKKSGGAPPDASFKDGDSFKSATSNSFTKQQQQEINKAVSVSTALRKSFVMRPEVGMFEV